MTAPTRRNASQEDEDSYLEIDNHDGEVASCSGDDADANATGTDTEDGTCSVVGLPRVQESASRENDADDADDADSVVVTIDAERLRERRRLTKFLGSDQLASLDVSVAVTAERDRVQRYVETDLELQREIEMIVRESIRPTTDRCISVLLNNQVILVPVTIRISDRLASYIWGTPRQYCPRLFPYVEEFDLLLGGLAVTSERRRVFAGVSSETACTLPRTFAVFAVRYVRTNCLAIGKRPRQQPQQQRQQHCSRNGWTNAQGRDIENIALQASTTNSTPIIFSPASASSSSPLECADRQPKKQNTIFGLYQYCDFSLVVVRDNRVIDYAVHGVHSNIAETMERQRPEVVYYNAQPGDALDVFVKYEWQPFYECLRDRAKPVNIYRNTRELFNTLPFCSRSDIFCSFCHALRDVRSLVARPWQIARSNDADGETRRDTRYSPYHKTRRNADWRHYARSRRPKRMHAGRFNYNSNCASFRV